MKAKPSHEETSKKEELGVKQSITRIKAASIQKSGLKQKSTFQLCPKFLAGLCRNHEKCHPSHEICEIVGVERQPTKPELCSTPNYLSTKPRIAPSDGWAIDNDGPGHFSSAGPRHQNDHVNIQDISILPTVDEILSRRIPYVPRKDSNHPHRLPSGRPRLIDINFRQLRFDSTESIIDICYHASQRLVFICSEKPISDYETRQQTPAGNQYSLFRDITFTHSQHELKGAMIEVFFQCPQHLYEMDLYTSKELEEGMLAALIGLDKEKAALSVTFLEIQGIRSSGGVEDTDVDELQG